MFQKIKVSLSYHNDFTAIEPLGYSHQTLHLVWFIERIFEQLLTARLDPFPQKIRFRTFSNRHKKSYWIEIHLQVEGILETTIEAEIVGIIIELRGDGMTGFSVSIPSQLQGMNIELK